MAKEIKLFLLLTPVAPPTEIAGSGRTNGSELGELLLKEYEINQAMTDQQEFFITKLRSLEFVRGLTAAHVLGAQTLYNMLMKHERVKVNLSWREE